MSSSIAKIVLVVVTVLALVNQIEAEMTLQLKMDSFLNPFGRKNDQTCCHSQFKTSLNEACPRNCTTYFRFCLGESGKTACVYEFVSNVLGGDSISHDQFKLTTDSIGFPSIDHKLGERLELTVEVLNQADRGQAEVINKWTISIQNKRASTWSFFEEKSLSVFHKLAFQYRMKCSRNFYGPNCELRSNEPDIKCENDGVCEINDQTGRKYCRCNSFLFKGDRCQFSAVQSKCSLTTSPCLNGGTCQGDGECLCPPGYVDDRCQTPRPDNQCGKVTCYNGGSCYINSLSQQVCACDSRFTGQFCEVRVNSCSLEQQPCQNGAQCIWNPTEGSHTCKCRSGFTGLDCSVVSETTTTPLTTTTTPKLPVEILAFLTPVSRVEAPKGLGAFEIYTTLSILVLVLLVVFLVHRLRSKSSQVQQTLPTVSDKLEYESTTHKHANIYSVDLSDFRPVKPVAEVVSTPKQPAAESTENIYSVIPLDTLF